MYKITLARVLNLARAYPIKVTSVESPYGGGVSCKLYFLSFTISLTNNSEDLQMQQIVIKRQFLSPKPKYLYNSKTQMFDYLGQILQQSGHPVTPKRDSSEEGFKFPDDIGIPIPPFTRYCRGRLVMTDLAINIMNLTPSPESELKLVEWLKDWYEIRFV